MTQPPTSSGPGPVVSDQLEESSGAHRSGQAAQGGSSSTKDVAKGQASDVKDSAKQSGQQVAGVAKDQASNVADETKNQARDLLHQSRSELQDQAGAQQKRVAGGLRSLGDELHSMAEGSEQSGPATDFVRQAADRTSAAASWLDDREPGALLEEIKGFARQRPAAFLALAAGAGVLAGRLTRGAAAGPDDGTSASSGTSGTSGTTSRPTSSGTPPIAGTAGLADDPTQADLETGRMPGEERTWQPAPDVPGRGTPSSADRGDVIP